MSFQSVFNAANISASGLTAERLRMEVVANNIANAFSTRTPEGGPYRRKDVIFSAVFDEQLRAVIARGGSLGAQAQQAASELGGVAVVGIVDDQTDLPVVYQPGHPDANRDGFVVLPNVQLPIEMVNLITANRSYEANLKVLQAFRQQLEQTLLIVRGS
jgi:flagellar basal-body rod protein FlgC